MFCYLARLSIWTITKSLKFIAIMPKILYFSKMPPITIICCPCTSFDNWLWYFYKINSITFFFYLLQMPYSRVDLSNFLLSLYSIRMNWHIICVLKIVIDVKISTDLARNHYSLQTCARTVLCCQKWQNTYSYSQKYFAYTFLRKILEFCPHKV